MRILAFYQYFSTNDVCGGTRPYEIAHRLHQAGDSVTIIAANWVWGTGQKESHHGLLWKRTQVEGIDVIRVTIPFGASPGMVPRIIGFCWFIPFALLAALTVRKPDVVVASSTPLTIGIPGYLLSRLHRVPFIFELRDLWPDCPVLWGFVKNRLVIRLAYLLESFLYRKAAFLITLTEGIRKEVISKKGVSAERVVTITNAADLALFTPDGPRADLERLANIPADAFVCLHSGRLGFANSLDFLLDGAAKLLHDPSIHFVLMGHGPEKARLSSEVSRRNLHNVHFLAPVPKAAVPAFVRRADLGIVFVKPGPLTYIFLQNKFFDYLACGCPIVVNFEGEAREYVEPANAGLFVAPGNVEALVSVIRNLAGDRATARQMRIQARQVAEQHFSWDYKAADFRKTISSVLSRNRSRSETSPLKGAVEELGSGGPG